VQLVQLRLGLDFLEILAYIMPRSVIRMLSDGQRKGN
jgi:hypothetical protein